MSLQSPLWKPSSQRAEQSNLMRFAKTAETTFDISLKSSDDLFNWSVADLENFWSLIWDHCGVVGHKGSSEIHDADMMPGARFFPEAELNFAENLLRFEGGQDAIVFRSEDKVQSRISRNELRNRVSVFQQALKDAGITRGDRVAAMMPNMIETIVAVAAVASLGAIWSSCSPDFGVKGVLDRFGQIEPKLFIACDGYWYNGKKIDISGKLAEVIPGLGAEINVIVPLLGQVESVTSSNENCLSLEEFTSSYSPMELEFERLNFDHPLYILFSSGTTGIPKCIVHSHGGSLLQHLKEHQLTCGLSEGDRLFYFTTCGWMMWNWLVSGLASGLTLILYDGSPFYPDGNVLFDYADDEQFTLFGTSAKFLDAVRKGGLTPISTHDLSSVKTITSTGSPLAPENFEFVYSGIKKDVHLASMSGGTDICGCFVGADATRPVVAGEIQAPCLGMAVEVWDDDGTPIKAGKGELVCTKPFPSVPVKFWNDPDGSKYHSAYFDRFNNIWCHGDFAEWTESGGMIIHGRSDATLNPGGVRIGTAEIYNIVEQMVEVEEALCVGQAWANDVRVVLFVRLRQSTELTEELVAAIKSNIRSGATPRHVPAKVIEVADIPRTKSGKITEIAVREIIHGGEPKNVEALANPEALEYFRNIAALAED